MSLVVAKLCPFTVVETFKSECCLSVATLLHPQGNQSAVKNQLTTVSLFLGSTPIRRLQCLRPAVDISRPLLLDPHFPVNANTVFLCFPQDESTFSFALPCAWHQLKNFAVALPCGLRRSLNSMAVAPRPQRLHIDASFLKAFPGCAARCHLVRSSRNPRLTIVLAFECFLHIVRWHQNQSNWQRSRPRCPLLVRSELPPRYVPIRQCLSDSSLETIL